MCNIYLAMFQMISNSVSKSYTVKETSCFIYTIFLTILISISKSRDLFGLSDWSNFQFGVIYTKKFYRIGSRFLFAHLLMQ